MTRRSIVAAVVALLGVGAIGLYSALARGTTDTPKAGGAAADELTVSDLTTRKNALQG